MKLLSKTSLNYVWLCLSVLLVSGFLLYFFLYLEVSTEIKEQLQFQEEMVSAEIKAGRQVNFPLVKTELVATQALNQVPVFKDTLVFDFNQKVQEGYYLLRQPRLINGKVYLIQVMTTHIGWDEYSKTISFIFIFIAVMLIVVGSMMNYFLNRKIWKPFLTNLATIKNYSVSSGDAITLQHSTINEFKEMNSVVFDLVQKASREYRILKEFTENASHEIQTPVAIVKSRLERISQFKMEEEMAGYVQDAKQALNRLSKINKGLLLLAKLENKSFPDQVAIDLKSVINEQLTQLDDLFSYKKITLDLALQSKTVFASSFLVDVLVSNLLSNIVTHSVDQAKVAISLTENNLTLSNSGEALDFDQEKLFTRFNKGKTSIKGNGLGLPIVKQICQLYGWQISYAYKSGCHIFSIKFANQ